TIVRDPNLLLDWWRQQDLDVSVMTTPTAEFAFSRGITNPNVRVLLIGGDRLHRPIPESTAFSVVNNYGPTETTIVATAGRLGPSDRIFHVGRPIKDTHVFIVDESEQLAGASVIGELYIGGMGVARGYLNRPELTAERFVPDAFGPTGFGRIYAT